MRSYSSLISANRAEVWPHTALAAVAALLVIGGCSSPLEADDADGVPDFSGSISGASGSPTQATSNQATPPVSPGNGTGTPGSTPAASAGEQNPANGAPIAPSTNTNSGNNGTGGANGGAGGSSMVSSAGNGGNVAAGGASMGLAGSTAMPPVTPPPGGETPPVVNPPPVVTPTAPDTTCPGGAIFCSGFEGTGFPAGTTFEPSYLANNAFGTEMTLDATQAHSGRQSLHMPVGSNYYRMLSVAVPTSFWVRLYTRSNVGFGAPGSTHATLFMGSIVAPGGDYNADRAVEIAEQFSQILLNVKDSLFGTSGTNPNGMPGTTLPNNTWTCMEAQFDGTSGDVQVFVEGNPIIDATGWQAPMAFKSFRFGYLRFDSPARDVWMDDVVVATSRIGCM
jgi:hypothetical protein